MSNPLKSIDIEKYAYWFCSNEETFHPLHCHSTIIYCASLEENNQEYHE